MLDKSTDLKKTTKKRHRRVLSIQKNRKLAHQEKQNECKVKQLLKQYLGGSDVVKETNYGARRGYLYKCPECGSIIKDKLSRHLSTKHKYEESKSLKKQSELRVMYLWCRSNKHGCPLPLPCTDCNRWFLRLDHHLLYDKKHKLLSAQERDDIIREARNSCWERGARKDTETEEEKRTEHLQTSSHGQTATSEVADKSDEEKTDFVRLQQTYQVHPQCQINIYQKML